MRLYEFEAKQLLRAAGIATPVGIVISDESGLASALLKTKDKVVLKVQVPIGGRQKAGGIILAEGLQEAAQAARSLLGTTICGFAVDRLLVEQRLCAQREFYLAITYDPIARCPVVVASREGGIEVEETAARAPNRVVRNLVDMTRPFSDYRGREVASALSLSGKSLVRFGSVVNKLYELFHGWDSTIAEINPLIETEEGEFVAVDAHVEIEDDAVYRHTQLRKDFGIEPRESRDRPPTSFELKAAEIDARDHRGVAGRVVEFDGSLGLLIGGGGASLTVFDAILDQGGRPANYCEIGGNPSVGKIRDLAKLILSKPGVRQIAVIMNVVNNTRVDLVARGVIKGVVEMGRDPRDTIAIFRIPGAWEEEGFKILERYGVEYCDRTTSIDEAARRAVGKGNT